MCSSSLLLVTTAPTPQGSCIRQVYALKLYGFHLLFHIVCSRRKFLSSFALTKDTVVVIFCKDGVEHMFFLNSHVFNCLFSFTLFKHLIISEYSHEYFIWGDITDFVLFCDFQLSFLGVLSAGYAAYLTVSLFSLVTDSFHYFLLFFLTLRNTQAYVFLGSFLRLPICSIDVW